MRHDSSNPQPLSLSEATSRLLDECRMVLPGIQALFGFQMIAVFSDRFERVLSYPLQMLHISAIALVAIAIALIMTPAAFHRLTSPERATELFLRVSTRLLLISMVPLLLAISAEVYIVGVIILPPPAAGAVAGALLLIFVGLWFVLPKSAHR